MQAGFQHIGVNVSTHCSIPWNLIMLARARCIEQFGLNNNCKTISLSQVPILHPSKSFGRTCLAF